MKLSASASAPSTTFFVRQPQSKVPRFAEGARVKVNAQGAWSPATIEFFEEDTNSYIVTLSLTHREIRVSAFNVRLADVKLPPLEGTASPKQLRFSQSPAATRAGATGPASSAAAARGGAPERTELSKLQLEIKALNWLVRSQIRLSVRTW